MKALVLRNIVLIFLFGIVIMKFFCIDTAFCSYEHNGGRVDVENDFGAVIMGSPLVWYENFGNNVLGLTGKGQVIGVADMGVGSGILDKIHLDLKNKIEIKDYWGDGYSDPLGHGVHILGSMVGTGKHTGGRLRGVAPDATVYFQALYDERLGRMRLPNMYDLISDAYQRDVRIYSNSWGVQDSEAIYEYNSHNLDKFIWEHPDMLVLKSAGNFDEGSDNRYVTAPGMAKNVITVGASESPRGIDAQSDNPYEVAGFSRRGTVDGRIKPDVVAPGTWILSLSDGLMNVGKKFAGVYYTYLSGTSMANAFATGAAAILRQYFIDIKGVKPSAALIKAAMIYGANDMPKERREAKGFGLIDIQGSIMSLEDKSTFFHDDVFIKDKDMYHFNLISDGKTPLKAVLVWSDYPADFGSERALVNNLDLKITFPDGRVFWGNSIIGGDRRNNAEVIVINNPAPGKYRLEVIGRNVLKRGQRFSLIYGHIPLKGTVQGFYKNEVRVQTVKGDVFKIPSGLSIRLIVNNIIERNVGTEEIPAKAVCYYFPESELRNEAQVEVIYDAAYAVLINRPIVEMTEYIDIEGHWAENAVYEMSKLGVVEGYPDGSFRPDDMLTRAQFVTMMIRFMDLIELDVKQNIFYDVERSAWYSCAINTAHEAKLAFGYSKYLFGPKNLVTREELAVMMARAAGYELRGFFTEDKKTELDEYLNNHYIDYNDVSVWARPMVSVMLKEGVLVARDENRIEPKQIVTRAEAVMALKRLMKLF